MFTLCLLAALALVHTPQPQAEPERQGVRLLGVARVPWDATDLSGLEGTLSTGTPHSRLGAFGSAIAYTGEADRYIVLPDRGPSDGADVFRARFHEVDIAVSAAGEVTFTLVRTVLLSDADGTPLVGHNAKITPSAEGVRFDAEGVRVLPDGALLITDEFGPRMVKVDRQTGRVQREYAMPVDFVVANPREAAKDEMSANARGRVTNAGLEGVALSPDGTFVVGIMQGPLIQDGGKQGVCLRVVRVDLSSGQTSQWVYVADGPKERVSEILAVDNHRYLVIERDGERGEQARSKRITLIDTRDATDVSAHTALSVRADDLPAGVKPVAKRDLLNLVDVDTRTAWAAFPEKVEGLAWGPSLPDGSRLLLITSDNDFIKGQDSVIWAVAVSKEALNGER